MSDIDNKMERTVASLEFNARQGSWFDMWHTHMDWDGRGDDGFAVRSVYLIEAIKAYDTFCGKMEQRGKPYQAWILVDLLDASEDAVYIHSPDPSGESPYPFDIGLMHVAPAAHDAVGELFAERGFTRYVQAAHDDMCFFARLGAGDPLAEA